MNVEHADRSVGIGALTLDQHGGIGAQGAHGRLRFAGDRAHAVY